MDTPSSNTRQDSGTSSLSEISRARYGDAHVRLTLDMLKDHTTWSCSILYLKRPVTTAGCSLAHYTRAGMLCASFEPLATPEKLTPEEVIAQGWVVD